MWLLKNANKILRSPTGSAVHGIFQARTPERVAIFYSRGIFLTQGWNLNLPHWQVDSLTLSHLATVMKICYFLTSDSLHIAIISPHKSPFSFCLRLNLLFSLSIPCLPKIHSSCLYYLIKCVLLSFKIYINIWLPWWLGGEKSACQCRRYGFDLWSGKIPHAAE